jgi:pimeloyl-ACP methyl ester carboxylesterase
MTKLPPAVTQASPRRISGLPAVEYHAMRALSASGAWLLAEECAAKFLWRSPWNPLYVPEAKSEFDIGVAAHLAVLEPERQADKIVLIEAGDYRTTKAREARDAARATGLVPLLPYQVDIVRAIAGSIRGHPIASEAFRGGEAEVTLIWSDPQTGIPCKARPDYLPAHGRWIVDLKTAATANPRSWRDQAYRFGYHARAAWYLDGAAAVLGQMPEEYWFVIVEKEPPYLVSVVSFDQDALSWGRIANRKACERFAVSAAANDWPGYRDPGQNHDRAFRIGLPLWAIYQLQDRYEAGEFTPEPVPEPSLQRAERFFAIP